MTTTSFPIEGQNLVSAAWSKLMRRQHQGVDAGMSLSLSSTSNDATISTGRASFMGFELEVTVAHVVTLAAVGSPTTYVIGVLYNPADEGNVPGGPLSLVSGVKGSITIPSGGALWPLWEITRAPSQTLNLATVISYRVARASLLHAGTGVSDPDPAFAQGGQVLVRRDGFKLLEGGVWVPVKDDTGDITAGFTASSGWSNASSTYRILNGQVTLHLRATRTGATITGSSTGDVTDSQVLTVPAAALTTSAQLVTGRGTVTLAGAAGTQGFDWRLTNTGVLFLVSTNPSVAIAAGAVLYATASYAL